MGGELDEKFVEYRDSRDMTTSEAMRSLVRDGLQTDDESDEHSKPMSVLESLAGDNIALQLRVFGWYIVFTAIPLWAFEVGLIGGVIWLAPTALFAFLAVATTLAIAVSVGQSLRPSSNSNKVKA